MFHLLLVGRIWKVRVRLAGWSKWKTFSLRVTDKRVAQVAAEKLVQRLERQAAGILPSDAVLDVASKPLLDRLPAYLAYVEDQGCSANTVRIYASGIALLCRECRWVYFRDVTANSFEDMRSVRQTSALVRRQSQNAGGGGAQAKLGGSAEPQGGPPSGYSAKYINSLLGTIRAYLAWAVRRGYLDCNPLRHVQPSKIRAGRGVRRALTVAELARFIECTPSPVRRAVYMVAYYFGLRRTEMARLRRCDFDLDGPRPVLRIPGNVSKNCKAAVLDVPAAVLPALNFLLSSVELPFAYAFKGCVPKVPTLRGDIAAAGIAYVVDGRRFDFHAIRKTRGTHLREAGIPAWKRKILMRLSSERLLDDIYCDDPQSSLLDDVNKLPAFGFDQPRHGPRHEPVLNSLAAS
jgi:integrase